MRLIPILYPNPSAGVFTLDLHSDSPMTLEVFTQEGKMIIQKEINQRQVTENLYAYPDGLYTLRFYDASKNFDSKKLILRK